MLPIAAHSDIFSPYFDTPHGFNFEDACKGFYLPYTKATTRTEFELAYATALERSGPAVIEVISQQGTVRAIQTHMHALATDASRSILEALARS